MWTASVAISPVAKTTYLKLPTTTQSHLYKRRAYPHTLRVTFQDGQSQPVNYTQSDHLTPQENHNDQTVSPSPSPERGDDETGQKPHLPRTNLVTQTPGPLSIDPLPQTRIGTSQGTTEAGDRSNQEKEPHQLSSDISDDAKAKVVAKNGHMMQQHSRKIFCTPFRVRWFQTSGYHALQKPPRLQANTDIRVGDLFVHYRLSRDGKEQPICLWMLDFDETMVLQWNSVTLDTAKHPHMPDRHLKMNSTGPMWVKRATARKAARPNAYNIRDAT
ncbi:hypothetical protein BD410DRAFT_845414 [Rickenella mellea]|uniref:Uncharacterized protein n=1 Tax=Rickenella mellea TaxID=50990 RepID=A0A4Y7PJI1_9AGAM|nr:hypothetical protein BD410DRAFT_845414 [Rickenella mellea]